MKPRKPKNINRLGRIIEGLMTLSLLAVGAGILMSNTTVHQQSSKLVLGSGLLAFSVLAGISLLLLTEEERFYGDKLLSAAITISVTFLVLLALFIH